MQPSAGDTISNNELQTQVNDLKKEIALLQATIESQKDTLIFSIDENYIYTSFNQSFRNATRYAYGTDVASGTSLFDCITNEDDRVKAKTNCDRAMTGESHSTVEEYGTINPSFFETHYNPILDSAGKAVGVAVLSSDVTSRVLAEQQIRSLSKELESFTYTAAHDLRVPLRVIDGYSSILAEDYADTLDAEGKRLIGIISNQVSHMGRLIDDLLSYAQLGRAPIVRNTTELEGLFRQAIEEQSMMVQDMHAAFKFGEILPCNCDSALIRIVLANLISNALKYSAKREHPVVEIGSYRERSKVVYFVKDNGFGFDMKYAGKLFGIFQRLHKPSEYEGTGVGLAMVHRIIGKHGGKVWFEAEVDKGATFFFSLQA